MSASKLSLVSEIDAENDSEQKRDGTRKVGAAAREAGGRERGRRGEGGKEERGGREGGRGWGEG